MTLSTHPLFVYGTLMSGRSAAGLTGDRRRGEGWVNGRLYHLPAGYPGLLPGGDTKVYGEWVEPLPLRVMDLLDHYEGVGSGLFERVALQVCTGRERFDAWAYVMVAAPDRGGRLLPSGRWRPVHGR